MATYHSVQASLVLTATALARTHLSPLMDVGMAVAPCTHAGRIPFHAMYARHPLGRQSDTATCIWTSMHRPVTWMPAAVAWCARVVAGLGMLQGYNRSAKALLVHGCSSCLLYTQSTSRVAG